MIEAIPLECAVHPDAYLMILGLLGEEVAHALLYNPWGCVYDRDHGAASPDHK